MPGRRNAVVKQGVGHSIVLERRKVGVVEKRFAHADERRLINRFNNILLCRYRKYSREKEKEEKNFYFSVIFLHLILQVRACKRHILIVEIVVAINPTYKSTK